MRSDVHDESGAGTAVAPALGPALGSDPHGFAGLYIRHRASFTSHARRYLRDPRDADEVVQEAFLRLFLAMPELETELQALAYCRRTITNLCIDRYRADARRPRLVALEGAPLDDLAEDDTGDPVVRAEDAALVREALSQLPALHRAALVKREIEEKPLPVIAGELDVAEDSVKHLLFRARRHLRKLLAGTSVAPGVDAELTRGLRPAARGASGGVAGLLLLALLGIGSGPDLRAVPVVGVDLPDVLGVTAVADAVGGAVRDVVGAIVPGGRSEASAAARDLRERPTSPAQAPTAGPVPPVVEGQIAQPIGSASTAPATQPRYPQAPPASPAGVRTTTVVTVVDGRPVVSVVPVTKEPLLAPVPATGGQVTTPATSSDRGPAPSLPSPVAVLSPAGGRDVLPSTPVGPTAGSPGRPVTPSTGTPAGQVTPDSSGRSPRADEAVQKAADKVADAAEKVEKAVDRGADKAADVAAKAQDKAEKAAEKVEQATAKSAEKSSKAAEKPVEKSEKAAEKSAEKSEKAAEKSAEKSEKAAEKAAEKSEKAAEKSADKADKAADKGAKDKAAKASADRSQEAAAQRGADRTTGRAAEAAAPQSTHRAVAPAPTAAARVPVGDVAAAPTP